MKEQQEKFLNLKTNPARLSAEQTAWYWGVSPHEIPVLMVKGQLKPLGHPQPNTMNYFAAATVEELRKDVKWLSRATDAIMQYWRDENARKSINADQADHAGLSADETERPLERR